jgi:hypothetical protein
MTTFCLELRSTANWSDVRYREYTTSSRKASLFKLVPRINFTDSGHGIVPVVREHSGRKEPRNMLLADHVRDSIVAMNKPAPRKAVQAVNSFDLLVAALEKIACRHVTEQPLWWQEEARRALAAAKGNGEG